MFDLGWTELLVIGVVALIVVGPKDLPVLFRRVGQFVGKAKGMAREFSQAMNDAADESGMREVSSSLNKSLKTATNPLGSAMDEVKDATRSLTNFDPDSETGKLAAQKAEDVKKIQASTARAAAERKQREAAEAMTQAEAAEAKLSDATPAEAAKPAAKKAAPAKPAIEKAPAAKKPAVKKTAAKKPAAKKPATKKPAAPKPAAKKE
ncbi:Sec-independent protein translocase protein TatB [Sulfitobacter dubius]|uniref:Sec-independent protein translocase protein TatB n=1 Tax=Sulfitobacter dubius TaxID=218673 RepID=UPI0008F078A6|nr:Sec-independent protein translocase protein TatB [Sulfitobacter dubius]SFG48139.1 sec-independent protein translocase protein TatB [Sulfitobacter dubius]